MYENTNEINNLRLKLDASEHIHQLTKKLSSTKDFNITINEILAELGIFLNADNTFIFELKDNKFSITHEWCKNGIPTKKHLYQDIPADEFSALHSMLEINNCITLTIDNSEYLRKNNIPLCLITGIAFENEIIGFIGIENPLKEYISAISDYISSLGAYIGISMVRTVEHQCLKRNNLKLRDSRDMNYELLNAVNCGVFAYSLPDYKIFNINKEARRIIECSDDEDIKTAFKRFYTKMIHPEDRTKVISDNNSLEKNGGEITHSYRINGKNGTKYVKSVTKRLKFANGQSYILASIQDVTKQQKLMDSLKKERKSCREALMNNCRFSFFFDMTEGIVHQEFVTTNEINIVSSLGLTMPVNFDTLAQQFIKINNIKFPEKGMEKYFSIRGLKDAFRKGRTNVVAEFYTPATDTYTQTNALISEDDETKHLNVFIIATDITKSRKKYEEKHRELISRNEDLSQITDEMTELLGCGIFAYSLPERTILAFNQEARQILNAHDIVIGKSSFNIMAKVFQDDVESIREAVKKLNQPGDSTYYIFHTLKQDGSIATLRCYTKMLSLSNGKKYILSSIYDITEQEALEKRLENERRQYLYALSINNIATFSVDLTEGMFNEEIITKKGENITKELNLSLPVSYDNLARKWFSDSRIKTENNDFQLLKSRHKLLTAYKKGTSVIDLNYSVPEMNRYIHLIVVMFKINDHINANFIMYDTSEKMKKEKEYNEIFHSAAKICTAIYRFELTKNMFTAVKPLEAITDISEDSCNLSLFTQKLADNFVAEQEKTAFLQFLSADNISRCLSSSDCITAEFAAPNSKKHRINLVAAERDSSDNVKTVLYFAYDAG